ncbi:metallo-beta-lactamase superfamily protein [Stackebrandtia endophytica]|uniref:Metallo-beta-lactamase superfamily protein n=1 Tax=Stackebrandtia endophytica TaxID=1496996 RepID=A0A543AUZ2_9ACTN|nr:MBL fold metallo-hydrolase [Stackebrandtia endophytica]TQL76406.1 metallo-beta-lactamase superfamily protein [Stackebrandtia endophytica]
MPVTRRVGAVEITALTDAEGPFFSHRHEAFPDATAEQFAAADRFDPTSVTEDGRWWLQFRAFAIRGESGVTMVDTGIGPADSPASVWAPVPGRLPAELAAAGISPDEITTVVLTHLHTDHVGWAVAQARPYFRNARYVLQTAEHDAVDRLNPQLRRHLLEPLLSNDQLSLIDGDEELTDTIRIVATPGHTPGHQSVLVGGDDPVAVTGDLLVHPVQLLFPEVAYSHESDSDVARESRMRMLAHIAINSGQLATPHLTAPFVEVPSPSPPS